MSSGPHAFLTLSLASSLSTWALENTTLGGEAAGGVVEGAEGLRGLEGAAGRGVGV